MNGYKSQDGIKNIFDLDNFVDMKYVLDMLIKCEMKCFYCENQVYVIGVNRIGEDGNAFAHSGDTAVINPKGEIISKTIAHQDACETIILSGRYLEEFRKLFPVLNDGDEFELK